MSRLKHALSATLMASSCFLAAPSHALSIDVQGKLAYLSGDVDFPDTRRIDDAIKKGASIFVMKGIGGGDVDGIDAVRRHIRDKKLTTVIDGQCSGGCMSLFLGGTQRYFAVASGDQMSIAYVAGVVERGTNKPVADTSAFTELDEALNEAMPRSLINKYTTWWDGSAYLGFAQPTRSYPGGVLLACPRNSSCQIIDENLSPLKVGFITSNQLFDLGKQEPGAAPTALKD